MTHYSLRSFDLEGAAALSQSFACRDDLEALAEGVRRSGKWSIEIWQGQRLVARVKLGNAPLDSADARCL